LRENIGNSRMPDFFRFSKEVGFQSEVFRNLVLPANGLRLAGPKNPAPTARDGLESEAENRFNIRIEGMRIKHTMGPAKNVSRQSFDCWA
jgi:hypothetical protein